MIASRKTRFMSFLIDLLLASTVIGGIINLYFIFFKYTTLGNILSGIDYQSLNGKKTRKRAIFLRIFTICPNITFILLGIGMLISYILRKLFIDNGIFIGAHLVSYIGSFVAGIYVITFILNIIELFFKEPTFVERIIGIKRIQNKEPKKWIFFICIILFMILFYFYGKFNNIIIRNDNYIHENNIISTDTGEIENKDTEKDDISDIFCSNVENDKDTIIKDFFSCLDNHATPECFILFMDKYDSTKSFGKMCTEKNEYFKISALDTMYENYTNCLGKTNPKSLDFAETAFKCIENLKNNYKYFSE